MKHEGHQVSQAEFEMNLLEKLKDQRILDDMRPLLTTGASWDYRGAKRYVLHTLAPLMPEDEWLQTNKQLAL